MAKADVTTLANTLMDGLGDATQLGNYYDEVIQELGRGMFDVLSMTGGSLVAGVRSTGTYSFPSTAIRVLAVFYDNEQLAEASPWEAQEYDPNWRETEGRPLAYTMADEDQHTVSLIPIPDDAGATIGGNTLFSFNPWPEGNLAFVYTETRADVRLDEELPMTLEIIAREYARDSDHHDMQASGIAKQLAKLCWRLCHARP